MKIEANEYDLKRIDSLKKQSPLERWNRCKAQVNFNVGDILVKEINRGWGPSPKWEVEKASQRSSFPAKYVFLAKDSNGIGYIKKLSADGKGTIGYPMSLYDMDLDRLRFTVDTDFQDAIILGGEEEYDPAKNHVEEKKLRVQIREYNMKLILKVKSKEELEVFLKDNKGNTIWVGNDRTGDNFYEANIGAITSKQSYDGAYQVVELSVTDPYDATKPVKKHTERIDYLHSNQIIFKTRPRSIEDHI